MKIANGTIVRLDYSVLTTDGELVEAKQINYEHGKMKMRHQQLLDALEGKSVGDVVELEIPNFFGVRDESDVKRLPRSAMPRDLKLEKGKRVEATTDKGKSVQLTVVDFSDKEVVLDGNHPLAGRSIVVRLKVLSVALPPPPPRA